MANGSKTDPNAATTAAWSGKVYQHWADGDAAKGTSAEWNNNILSDGKSDYFEGEVVPHAFIYTASNQTPLVNGQTYSFNVTYNYWQSNTNAGGFSFMTSPTVDRTPSALGGTSLPDPNGFVNGGGMQGNFHTVNADIVSVSAVEYTNGSGSKDAKVTVTFRYTGQTTTSGFAEIDYGLMIARPGEVPDQGKGATLGAHAWTGGSLQTTVDIGGSGATSLQLAPSAIIAGEISGLKFNDVNGDGVRQAAGSDGIAGNGDDEGPVAGVTIFLDTDHDGVADSGEASTTTAADGTYKFSVTPDADPSTPTNDGYWVREVVPTGWKQTSSNPALIVIDSLHPTATNVNFGNQQMLPSFSIAKFASVPGGTADVVGELISYTITLTNTGNQTLTGAMVSDPSVSNLQLVNEPQSADGVFNAGDVWHYSASRAVTQADIDAGGNILNTATGDTDQTAPQSASASVPVAQNPNFILAKAATVPGGTANVVGELISYTIDLTNNGNQTLTGVTVADPSVSNLQLVVDSASSDGKLNVGEVWHYTASRTVTQADIDAGGSITNVATGDTDQTPPKTGTATVPVGQNPDFTIVKAASVPGGTADTVGEIISYTITLTNTGNQTLTGLTLVDPTASNLQLVNEPQSADGVFTVGDVWHYTANHVVTQADLNADGSITNVATADTDQTQPKSATTSIPVGQSPNFQIIKAASVPGGTADVVGELISYTITMTNTGNISLTGVTVNDPSLSNLQLVNDPASNDGVLNVGETWTYTGTHAVVQADIDAGSNIINVATGDTDQTPPQTATVSVPVSQNPNFSIVKAATVPGGTANVVGELISYTIDLTNNGNQTLTGVTVNDPSVSNLQLVVDSASSDGKLNVGEVWHYTASRTVTQADIDAGGTVNNLATGDTDQTPPKTAGASVPVEQTPMLYIDKAIAGVTGGNGNSSADYPGDVLNYTITVYNAGNQTLTSVAVTDPKTNFSASGLTLQPGQSYTYNTSYPLTQSDLDTFGQGTGVVSNTATATSAQTGLVSDSEFIPILVRPSLAINKTFVNVDGGNGNGIADYAGDILHYTITLVNEGTVTLTNITTTDPLTGFSASGLTLAPGNSYVYVADYELKQTDLDSNGGGTGNIINTASAVSTQTPNPISDSEAVPLVRSIAMGFDERALAVTGGNNNGLADYAGDVLNFSFTVSNPGTVTLTNVRVTDALTGLDQLLAPIAAGTSATVFGTYTLKQSDLDSNGTNGTGRLENTSYVTSKEASSASDSETATLVFDPRVDLTKYVSVDNGLTWDDANVPPGPTLSAGAGFSPLYKFAVTNVGNITLPGVEVADNKYDLNGSDPGTTHLFGTLIPGAKAEWIFTGATFALGPQSDIASATVVGLPLVTDVDNAYYTGVV